MKQPPQCKIENGKDRQVQNNSDGKQLPGLIPNLRNLVIRIADENDGTDPTAVQPDLHLPPYILNLHEPFEPCRRSRWSFILARAWIRWQQKRHSAVRVHDVNAYVTKIAYLHCQSRENGPLFGVERVPLDRAKDELFRHSHGRIDLDPRCMACVVDDNHAGEYTRNEVREYDCA